MEPTAQKEIQLKSRDIPELHNQLVASPTGGGGFQSNT